MKHLATPFAITLFLATALATPTAAIAKSQTQYYYSDIVNAGLDTGYSETNTIDVNDPHFGWKLGTFVVSDYSSVVKDGGAPVFLKTLGDTVTLSFRLDQSIDALNGSETLSIADDSDGYDKQMGVERTDFGHGALIVRYTNYQNATELPTVYEDYLTGIEVGANTEVELCEEGDYEVVLDYETVNDVRRVGPVSLLPEYANYRVYFKFAVRNGNCMVFPLDAKTGSELQNEAVAPDGFTLNLANSRYLDVNLRRDVLSEGTNGFVEDTRFNGPAREGDRYTDAGIYTIKATNRYTHESTEKVIYVGTDQAVAGYVSEGIPVSQINERLGSSKAEETQPSTGNEMQPEEPAESGAFSTEAVVSPEIGKMARVVAIVAAAIAVVVAFTAVQRRRKRKLEQSGAPIPGEPSDDQRLGEPNDSNEESKEQEGELCRQDWRDDDEA